MKILVYDLERTQKNGHMKVYCIERSSDYILWGGEGVGSRRWICTADELNGKLLTVCSVVSNLLPVRCSSNMQE